MESITKIYPVPDQLKTVNLSLHCTEEGCTSVFTSESNLNLHLVKTHKKEWKVDYANKEYYCPGVNCIYNNEKHFKNLKLLKQHFLKVHSDKTFACESCNKGFSTLAFKNHHAEYCGIIFKCCDCTSSYSSYESLLTHGRRKKHKVLEKTAYNPLLAKKSSSSTSNLRSTKILIPPKASTSLQVIHVFLSPQNESVFEKSSQTEVCTKLPKLKTKQTQVNKGKLTSNNISKESQTSELQKIHFSAETQTVGDYISKKPKLGSSLEGSPQKSIKTQTKSVVLTSQACNTSFELDETEYISSPMRTSSSTQTVSVPTENIYSISTATHDSIYTDTSDLNFEFMNSSSQTCFSEDMSIFDSSTFFNCNTETQTDFMLENELFNYDDCFPNNQLQVDNLDDILFNTIHTQTVFDDMARSVESQTTMSHNKLQSLMSCRDMVNMDTQTDVDFKKLLEEINA